ncbi:hypothetical protein P3T76_001597 [Phytophthora citrophthora]|uniref:Uncharacterized protein n=1 Tax=Phytophthora citrophthora TaxID=4793 RepID=A0AAD9LUQ5_9STRA|nr:hypothetical protein P3T76_001597 [Phytophthora citrophthora]
MRVEEGISLDENLLYIVRLEPVTNGPTLVEEGVSRCTGALVLTATGIYSIFGNSVIYPYCLAVEGLPRDRELLDQLELGFWK